jgi:hypothetical protein
MRDERRKRKRGESEAWGRFDPIGFHREHSSGDRFRL